jgi:hypothetical protein
MNAPTSKNDKRRGLRLFDWLLKDWVWEVCLAVLVAPVVIHQFLSLGGQTIA